MVLFSRARSVFTVALVVALVASLTLPMAAAEPESDRSESGEITPSHDDDGHSHFRYGHIFWSHGDVANTVEFTVQNGWRRSGYGSCIDPTHPDVPNVPCSGPDGYPLPDDVVLETVGGTRFSPGDGTLIGSPRGSLLYLVTSTDTANDWLFAQALDPEALPAVSTSIEHTYASPGGYTAFTDDCCRTLSSADPNAHINNPDTQYRVETLVDTAADADSPVSVMPPIVQCPIEGSCEFTVPATDPAGDGVEFRFSTQAESGIASQPGPPHSDNGATIDPDTGLYEWDTAGATLGDGDLNTLYSTQVTIEDRDADGNLRSKVAVDFFIHLVEEVGDPPTFDDPSAPPGAVQCGTTVPAAVGQETTFTAWASDPAGDEVTLNVVGLPPGAAMAPPLPLSGDGTVVSDFSWTPTADQTGSHVLTFTAVDEFGQSAQCPVTVQVGEELVSVRVLHDRGDAFFDDAFTPGRLEVLEIAVADQVDVDEVDVFIDGEHLNTLTGDSPFTALWAAPSGTQQRTAEVLVHADDDTIATGPVPLYALVSETGDLMSYLPDNPAEQGHDLLVRWNAFSADPHSHDDPPATVAGFGAQYRMRNGLTVHGKSDGTALIDGYREESNFDVGVTLYCDNPAAAGALLDSSVREHSSGPDGVVLESSMETRVNATVPDVWGPTLWPFTRIREETSGALGNSQAVPSIFSTQRVTLQPDGTTQADWHGDEGTGNSWYPLHHSYRDGSLVGGAGHRPAVSIPEWERTVEAWWAQAGARAGERLGVPLSSFWMTALRADCARERLQKVNPEDYDALHDSWTLPLGVRVNPGGIVRGDVWPHMNPWEWLQGRSAHGFERDPECRVPGCPGIPRRRVIQFRSPVTVHVYDDEGRHTGLRDDGSLATEIPDVVYMPGSLLEDDDDAKFVVVPDRDGYRVEFDGDDEGLVSVDMAHYDAETRTRFEQYYKMDVSEGSHGVIDLGPDEEGIAYDAEGDGDYESVQPDTSTTSPDPQEDDHTPPVTSLEVVAAEEAPGQYLPPVQVAFTASDDLAGVDFTEYSLDEGETWETYTQPFALTDTGSYTITYRSVDYNDNVEPSQTETFGIAGDVLVDGGKSHSLAAVAGGEVWAWGGNSSGQLGDGGTASSSVPVAVGLGDPVATLAAGGDHSLAATQDGTVWAWGANSSGQLGDGSTDQSPAPVEVEGLADVTALAGGNYHSLAVTADGQAWAWGLNNAGQLGDGSTLSSSTPALVEGLPDVQAVAAGGLPGWAGHSVALASDGTVWTWGYNKEGQLGDGTRSHKSSPIQVEGLDDVVAIAAGGDASYALRADGTVWGWGDNSFDQLGKPGTGRRSTVPLQVDIDQVTALAAGDSHALAITENGAVWAWGNNNTGQLGHDQCGPGTPKTVDTPARVAELSDAEVIAGGRVHSLATTSDSTWAWGSNAAGQLGDGTTTARCAPVAVTGLPQ